jgi:hypothetical protein
VDVDGLPSDIKDTIFGVTIYLKVVGNPSD